MNTFSGTCDHPHCYGPKDHFGKHYGKDAEKECDNCRVTHRHPDEIGKKRKQEDA